MEVAATQMPESNQLGVCCTVYKLFYINYLQEPGSKYQPSSMGTPSPLGMDRGRLQTAGTAVLGIQVNSSPG